VDKVCETCVQRAENHRLLLSRGRDTLLLVKDLLALMIRYSGLVVISFATLGLISVVMAPPSSAGFLTGFSSIVYDIAVPSVLLAACLCVFFIVRVASAPALSRIVLSILVFVSLTGTALLFAVLGVSRTAETGSIPDIGVIVKDADSFLYIQNQTDQDAAANPVYRGVVFLDTEDDPPRFTVSSEGSIGTAVFASEPGPPFIVKQLNRITGILVRYAHSGDTRLYLVAAGISLCVGSLYSLARASRWPFWNVVLCGGAVWAILHGFAVLGEPAMVELIERFFPVWVLRFRDPIFFLIGAVLLQLYGFLQKPVREWRNAVGIQ
jgi:hypothetical protein